MTVLTESTWWQLLILAVGLGTVLGGLTAFITWIIQRFKIGFSIGKLRLSPGPAESTGSIEEAAGEGHRHCPRWKDFLSVTHIAMDSSKRIFEIERFDTIAEQMSYAEQCLSDVRQEMRGKFLKLLKEEKNLEASDGLLAMHESQDYTNVLRIMTSELKDAIRRVYLENHLVDMSEIEFEGYLKKRVNYLNERVTELLYDIYPSDGTPSRERIYDANVEIAAKVDDLFEDMIRRGRIIAVAKAKEVKRIRDDMDEKVKEIIDD
jgi:hypothetical protein